VEAMKGTIFFEPNKPQGSIFGFSIPIEAVPYGHALEPLHFTTEHTILIVDDNTVSRSWLYKLLTHMGAKVLLAASGTEALSILKAKQDNEIPFVDVCLIDQNMPGMDGWRLAAEIHSEKTTSSIPLILLIPEGEGAQESKMRLLTWFNGYISKPVNVQDLFNTIEQAVTEITELESPEEKDIEIALEQIESNELPLQILLVEDHTINQELYTILLEKFGCTVEIANNGAEAVEKAQKKPFDIILMDIFMPVMDGYEATKHIRELGFSKPIIAITASAIKGEHDKCIRAGMNDVLVKPFKRKDLETMLRFWSNKSTNSIAPNTENQQEMPITQSADTPFIEIFDYHELLATFLDNEDTVKNLINRFIKKIEDQYSQLMEAFNGGNIQAVRELAHSIKGASWNMTAKKLGNLARDIEYAAKDNDTEGIVRLFSPFERALQEFIATARPFAS
ncbi:MAG TPA: response regulator, partial [Spirochaetales bacterium]|nr:response regulator [Spirochaetales bacterium]